MRSLEWVLIPYDWCPYKKRKFGHRDRHAQREDDVKTQKECYPQAKEHLRLPGARGEAWIRFSPTALRRSQPCDKKKKGMSHHSGVWP